MIYRVSQDKVDTSPVLWGAHYMLKIKRNNFVYSYYWRSYGHLKLLIERKFTILKSWLKQ